MEPIEHREVTCAEEAEDRDAAPVGMVGTRVGHVSRWRGGDVDRRVCTDPVAGLEIGEDDCALGYLRAQSLQEPRRWCVEIDRGRGRPPPEAVRRNRQAEEHDSR